MGDPAFESTSCRGWIYKLCSQAVDSGGIALKSSGGPAAELHVVDGQDIVKALCGEIHQLQRSHEAAVCHYGAPPIAACRVEGLGWRELARSLQGRMLQRMSR